LSPLKIAKIVGAKMAVTMESCPSVGGPLPPEGSNGLDNNMETLFEISEMSPSEVEEIQNRNLYIKELADQWLLLVPFAADEDQESLSEKQGKGSLSPHFLF
jgi:hypothetical protein